MARQAEHPQALARLQVAVVCLVFVVLAALAAALTQLLRLQAAMVASPAAVQVAVEHLSQAVLQQQVEQVGAVSSS
jgi:hypothetical protein